MNAQHNPGRLLYADRDCEAMAAYYTAHVSAMTGEGLHYKSDIAAELAHRDMLIDELLEELDSCAGTLAQCFPNAPVDSVIGKNISSARAAIAKAGGEA